jgi:hypothetical protein
VALKALLAKARQNQQNALKINRMRLKSTECAQNQQSALKIYSVQKYFYDFCKSS